MSENRVSRRAMVLLVLLALCAVADGACDTRSTTAPASILLFTGTGTSSGDVAALEAILNANHLDYATASSAELTAMADEGLGRYRLLIVPGGNFVEIGDRLTPRTIANVRRGVQNGLNYLGICAGAFLAGSLPPPYKSLNLTSGVQFGFYAAGRDVRRAVVAIARPDGPTLDQYWEDGPQLAGWGSVVAKYPDGTPAVVQGTFGGGWVVLTGIHPEATERWRRGLAFSTPASTDHAFAATLIHAALSRTSLAHF